MQSLQNNTWLTGSVLWTLAVIAIVIIIFLLINIIVFGKVWFKLLVRQSWAMPVDHLQPFLTSALGDLPLFSSPSHLTVGGVCFLPWTVFISGLLNVSLQVARSRSEKGAHRIAFGKGIPLGWTFSWPSEHSWGLHLFAVVCSGRRCGVFVPSPSSPLLLGAIPLYLPRGVLGFDPSVAREICPQRKRFA